MAQVAGLREALDRLMALAKVAPEHRDRMQRWEHGDFDATDNTPALAGTDRTILIGQLDAVATGLHELRHSPHLWPVAAEAREEEPMRRDPKSPPWEDCKVCGGDHWTKDHPARTLPPPNPSLMGDIQKGRRADPDLATGGDVGPTRPDLVVGESGPETGAAATVAERAAAWALHVAVFRCFGDEKGPHATGHASCQQLARDLDLLGYEVRLHSGSPALEGGDVPSGPKIDHAGLGSAYLRSHPEVPIAHVLGDPCGWCVPLGASESGGGLRDAAQAVLDLIDDPYLRLDGIAQIAPHNPKVDALRAAVAPEGGE